MPDRHGHDKALRRNPDPFASRRIPAVSRSSISERGDFDLVLKKLFGSLRKRVATRHLILSAFSHTNALSVVPNVEALIAEVEDLRV
jgi:hypothetical protein